MRFCPGMIDTHHLDEDIGTEGDWRCGSVGPVTGTNAIFHAFAFFNIRSIDRNEFNLHIGKTDIIYSPDRDGVAHPARGS